jgi:O-methyltransferase
MKAVSHLKELLHRFSGGITPRTREAQNGTALCLPDVEQQDIEIIKAVTPYTLTSPERIHALCAATRYVVRSKIPGAIVECGVWKGGSMMAVARTLLCDQQLDRALYLFDTFDGMTPPGAEDVTFQGQPAQELLERSACTENDSVWCYAPIDQVKESLYKTGYPVRQIHFVPGRVEETIPMSAPSQIALLRLDTDWYESTKHELEHLFPRLSVGGVLIIDDYGHWRGARQAVDEYLSHNNINILLNRIDYTGRIAIKTSS